jgi:Tfp pilus assembly protein PilF
MSRFKLGVLSGSLRCVLGLLVLGAALVLPTTVYAQPAAAAKGCESPPARAVSVQGNVETKRGAETQWRSVQLNDSFCAGDTIRVGERSRADVALLNQSVLRLNANSTIVVEAPKEERTGVVELVRGAAHFFSRGPKSLEVKTPFTIAGVRGTEFYVSLEPDQTLITVFEGTVLAENASGSLSVTDGQSAVASAGRAPALRVVVRPRDAVQWALYYPPVVYFPRDAFAGPDWQANVRSSTEFAAKGDLGKAFESIRDVPADVKDARFFAYRAQLLLGVGRADEARADIDRSLQIAPNDPNALSLLAIIDVTQNEKDKAFDTAQKAVAAAPNSATARIALSYTQQARFDLAGARASVEKAVELDPANALAWARLAELQSSFGELDKSLVAAQKAVALEPNLSRTQTVLGFAFLTEVKTAQAREAFDKAITLDQADPLPRLGLGLAKIRDGKLDEGSRDIEVAASLDPNNGLVRSYLGKSYYEEKRWPLDEREYAMAKQLDPKDPTPYFYDAIAKQTTNRPVEALHDMEKAIELNDNRAIYRSQLLLDSDAAARSASLARIYTDLGFQELALVEGWKSVNTDPSNFSAHRFLADSYSVLPRHEIARVSELLQSQLLQPLNMTPLQPQLAESNLFLVSSQGPGTASFNEFNPVFSRDGYTVQLGALGGEHGTYSGDAIVAGINKNFSYSVGGYYFKTDGFRENADQKDRIANAFVQYDLSPSTSIQAEYRYRNTQKGDLPLRFFEEDFFPNERNRVETNSYRVGMRQTLTPNSILLGSVTYQDSNSKLTDNDSASSVALTSPQKAFGAEIQHLYRSRLFNLTSGIGYFKINGHVDSQVDIDIPPPEGPLSFTDTLSTNLKHVNVYVYSYLNPVEKVWLTIGASGDFLTGDSAVTNGLNQFNPKFGVTWEPIRGTTIRAAAFRVLKRTLITNQTLEPTQVAGFNQFFDDPNGTESRRYGVAIDQKFAKDVFGGLELSKRDLKVPQINQFVDPPAVDKLDQQESTVRAYAFWVPTDSWALRAEYTFERIRLPSFDVQPVVYTNRLPLGVNYFHPSGVTATLTTTFVDQHGTFARVATGELESGRDQFWIVDGAVSYRLPKRYGFLTVGVRNLFDKTFRYFDTDVANPTLRPTRTIFAQATFALP